MTSATFWIGPFLSLSLPTYKLGFSVESSSRAICIRHAYHDTQEAAVGGPCLCDSVLAQDSSDPRRPSCRGSGLVKGLSGKWGRARVHSQMMSGK